jgi:hypothetical protein
VAVQRGSSTSPLEELAGACEHLLRARLDDAAALELDLIARVLGGIELGGPRPPAVGG